MVKNYHGLITPELNGERLDRAGSALSGLSRGAVRRIIELGGAYIDGSRVRVASRQLRRDQKVELYWTDPPEQEPLPLEKRHILYEEPGIVGVYKPAGVYSQAARHRLKGTFAELVGALLGVPSPEPVHRLDRETSGVMLLALEPRAAARFAHYFAEKEIQKRYFALVRGAPERSAAGPSPWAHVELPLERDPDRPGQMRVASPGQGQTCATDWRVVESRPGQSLLEVLPRTGRTHQIRVHLSAIGMPILGDRLYGSNRARLGLEGELQLEAVSIDWGQGRVEVPQELRRVVMPAPTLQPEVDPEVL